MIKIALDAGHGIKTAGKRTPDGVAEWTLNSAVASKAEKLLSAYKDVEVIRLDDTTGKTDVALSTRMSKAVNNKVDVLVSIHHNAQTLEPGVKYGTATGVEIFISPRGTSESKKIATSIINKFASKSGMRNRGLKTANLAMVSPKSFPTMLVEGGFMNTTPDRSKLETSDYQNAYAQAIVDVLVDTFKLGGKSGYYTNCNLNLRKSASSKGELLVTIPKDTKVTVLDKSTDWYKVKVTIKKKTYTGYAFGRTYINKK